MKTNAYLSITLLLSLWFGCGQAAEITVTTAIDENVQNGVCSLREAMVAADTNANFRGCVGSGAYGNDLIVFHANLMPGGIGGVNVSGSLASIGGTVEIRVPPSALFFIQGDGANPVFVLNQLAGAAFKLTGVRVVGGFSNVNGGGLVVVGGTRNLILDDVVFSSNESAANGGAIGLMTDDRISIEIYDSSFFSNEAGGNGGVIGGPVPSIDNVGSELGIEIFDSAFSSNTATGSGGAIDIDLADAGNGSPISAEVIIETTQFTGNIALVDGGAINAVVANGALGTIFVDVGASIFVDNAAGASGGAIYMEQISGAPASNVRADIRSNRFEGNHSDDGGGAIAAVGIETRNNGPVLISRNSFVSNTAFGSGGAVVLSKVAAQLINNLLAFNEAGGVGGGLNINNIFDEFFGREYHIIGNTFHHNTAGATTNEPAGWNWHYYNPDPMNPNGAARFFGNATTAPPGVIPPGDSDCFRSPIASWQGEYNVGNDHTCANGVSDLLAHPDAPPVAIVHPVHNLAAIPNPGSHAIDYWAEVECRDHLGVALQNGMITPRRVGGVPIEGDGVPPANCDSGAFEAPKFVAPPIFSDGFESP